MKIFLAFLQSKTDHPIAAYKFWQYYIKNGIEEAGDTWIEDTRVDWAKGIVPKSKAGQSTWLADTWQKTIEFIKNDPPDFFLGYLYPEQVDEQAINEIKRMGIPCVNFFCDNVRLFRKLPDTFKVFNLNWVPEYKALSLYKKANAPYINLPMPMWVPPSKRSLPADELPQITFIGSADTQRKMLFNNILNKDPDLPLTIYGAGWGDGISAAPNASPYSWFDKALYQATFIKNKGIAAYGRKLKQRNFNYEISDLLKSRLKPSPDHDQYFELTANSQITIGVNRYADFNYPLHRPNAYSRLRDIEAPMLGAGYLTEWTEGIETLYDIDNEILTYTDADSFLSRCEQLIRQPFLRATLRKNGQHRALSSHSIPSSLQKIKERLFG
jgi:hypothetical protein